MRRQILRNGRLGKREGKARFAQSHRATGGNSVADRLDQREDGSWLGKLFIPDKNMRATAKLRLAGPQQLKVSGCAAGKALCKSALWTRTAEPLPVENGK